MSLRGTPVVGTVASGSVTLTLPAGSAVNDRALVFAGTAAGVANASLPSGWTALTGNNTGTTWNSMAGTKLLDATDISNGNIVVPTGFGGFDMNAGLAVFVGPLSVREYQMLLAQGPGSNSQSTTGAVTSSDEIVYWVSDRSSGAASAPTITPASGSATVVAGPSGGANSNCKIATQVPPGGALNVTYSSAGTLLWNGVQVVIDNGGIAVTGLIVQPGLDGLGTYGQLKGGCNG